MNVCRYWNRLCYHKRTIVEKQIQAGFVFKSVLRFADREITGKLNNYWLPLNHQWKKILYRASVNYLCFLTDDRFWSVKTLHMFVYTFSILTVTNNPRISKGHVCAFSTFSVTSNKTFSRTHVAKFTRSCSLRSLGFSKGRVVAPFWHWRPKVFLKSSCHHKPQAINVMVDSRLSLHCIFLSCFIACSYDEEQTWLN